MKILFIILLIGGLIAFSTYQVIQIVRIIKEKKKCKIQEKGEDKQ